GVLGALIERCEGPAAFHRQREKALPPVIRRCCLDHEPTLAKAAQDAAEIAVIEAEFGGNLRGCPLLALGKLVEHACLGHRVGGLQEAILQQAKPTRIATIEGSYGGDTLLEIVIWNHRAGPRSVL